MWHDNIDMLIYINLDSRLDRNIEILQELENIGFPKAKIQRFSALKGPGHPMVGCCLSHAAVLNLAYDMNLNNVLILEDDCQFIQPVDVINKVMTDFFKIDHWDALLLIKSHHLSTPYSETFEKCIKTGDAVSYLVSRNIMKPLAHTITQGAAKLHETGEHWYYQNDVVWCQYMKTGNWYSMTKSLCQQRDGFSDLSNQYVCHPNLNNKN